MTDNVRSPRHQQIQDLQSQGFSNRRIAIQLKISEETVRSSGAKSLTNRMTGPLTDRETQVADLIAAGLSSGEIALELSISERTVHAHRYRLSHKLRAHADVEAEQTSD